MSFHPDYLLFSPFHRHFFCADVSLFLLHGLIFFFALFHIFLHLVFLFLSFKNDGTHRCSL